ncbi:hypothetical protein LAT59_02500 [Candidatus Gracilibacteria bacterium]|nr:hypothetical protein [Candidatus Gracilibacteria bacterium]
MGLARYESETLSPQEIQILGNSETARERFLDLREKLKEAKMEKIFLHRNSIMQVIGNVHGIAFTLGENDYLSDAEMMRFIGETVYATLGEEAQHLRQTYSTTDEMIEQVISLNNESSSGGIFNVNQEDVNLFGDSHIEAQFINKFAPRGQLYFNLFAFEEAIRN